MTRATALPPDAWAGFQARLSDYIRRRVDPASVEDVVGAVLLRLVRHQEALKAADNPTAWMLRVAANAVADHHRRRAVEDRALEAFRSEAPSADPEPADGERVDTAEFARCLIPFIRGLPPAYGEALMLTEIEGLTQAEAAARLGLSVSGMKSRVQRGRAKLKQSLLRCCAVETDRWGTVLDYRERRPERGCTGDC